MSAIQFKGQKFNVDEDGFLDNLANWNEAWVQYVKNAEGIMEITEDHRHVIRILQDYYKKNGNTPRMGALTRNTGFRLSYIYELFPSGPARGACRMAGLPKPTSCV